MQIRWLLALLAISGCSDGAKLAFQSGSPWPKFRADAAQTGRSAVHPSSTGGRFWSFQTGKGIFSSPVLGADGTLYVGSADRTFYAINADGTLKWKLLTGEIIDSSGLLDDQGRVYFGSGDGHERALDAESGALVWMTAADDPSVNGAPINWFEGNVALSPSGELWAGNDDYFVYAFDRATGAIAQRKRVPDQTWSLPAFDAKTGDGYIGNNNVVDFLGSNLFAFHETGGELWDSFTGVGSVAASPLLLDDRVIVGGYDGYVRAYDRKSGAVLWELGARDHIYASPSLLPDGNVIQAAADGTVYAIDPRSGALVWQWNGRDPIRSSPAVDADGNSYFGAGDGRLWVLDAHGQTRWSVQLISADRNDLNASPALGKDAIYIAGESGEVFSVPYDYCLRDDGKADPRCAQPIQPTLPDDGAVLVYTTPFGSLAPPPALIDPNQPIVLSLVAREQGHDVLAVLDPNNVTVTFDPPADVHTDLSGDGKFLVIAPNQPLTPGADGTVGLTVTAATLTDLARTGLKLSGGTPGPTATVTIRAQLATPVASPYPLTIPSSPGSPGSTWEVSRLALPLPTLLPSYNQIGFDSLHYLVGLVEGDAGHAIAWMAGAKLAADENRTEIDPATRALVPLEVSYDNGYLTFANEGGVKVEVTNAVISLNTFRMAAALAADGNASGPLRVNGSTICARIAVYGMFLQRLGLCNPQTDVLSVSGAANLTTYASTAPAPSPSNVGTVSFAITADAVTATLTGSSLALDEHVAAVLLLDAATGKPITLDYGLTTVRTADAAGVLSTVSIPITGKTLPAQLRAHLIIDTTSVAQANLTLP